MVRWIAVLLIVTVAHGGDALDAWKGNDIAAWNAALRTLIATNDFPTVMEKLRPWAEDPRDGIALLSWSVLGDGRPDEVMIQRALKRSLVRPFAAKALVVNTADALRTTRLEVSADRDPQCAALAISGMIHAAPDEVTRRRIHQLRISPSPLVRARAAEWLRWHGSLEDGKSLRQWRDDDVHVQAVIASALTAIARRPATMALPIAPSPLLRYGGQGDEELHRSIQVQAEALRSALIPQQAATVSITAVATTGRMVDPVSGFSSERQGSYAARIPEGLTFGGTIHVGHDAAWYCPDAPVIAVADGIVRLADPALPSWGGARGD